MPGDEPDEHPEQHADDQRPDARLDRDRRARRRSPRTAWFGRSSPSDDADDDPDDDRDASSADDPARRRCRRASEHGGDRDRDEQQDAVEDAPAHRAEEPLADPERHADDEQEDREDDERDGERDRAAATRPTSPAIGRASALARSMWARTSAMSGVARRAELGAEPRRVASSGRPMRRCGRVGVAVPAVGRVVQGCAPAADRAQGVSSDDSSASRAAPAAPARGALRCGDVQPIRARHILTAELLSIGSELTVGETRDTNAGELARSLTGLGVRVEPADGPARRPRRR